MKNQLRKITVKGNSLFTVTLEDKTYPHCTIETLDGKKYGILDMSGKLLFVIKLNKKETKELYSTGRLRNKSIVIESMVIQNK